MRGQTRAGLEGDCGTHRAQSDQTTWTVLSRLLCQKTALRGVRVCDPNKGPLQKLCQGGESPRSQDGDLGVRAVRVFRLPDWGLGGGLRCELTFQSLLPVMNPVTCVAFFFFFEAGLGVEKDH